MSLQIIEEHPWLTQGEQKILRKIKDIYKGVDRNAFLYVQPKVKHLEPDFILVDPLKGLSVIEVKDWSLGYIESIDRKYCQLAKNRKEQNPALKLRQYLNFTKSLLEEDNSFFDEHGNMITHLFANLILTNFSNDDFNNLLVYLDQSPVKSLCAPEISNLDLEKLFGIESCNLKEDHCCLIRSKLCPEIKIIQTGKNFVKLEIGEKLDNFKKDIEIIKTLDLKQEKFAKQLPYGHCMITGIPGSGKTVILISRAIFLAKRHPDWQIRILVYNKSLEHKIKQKLDKFDKNENCTDINLENISVSTFHSLAKEIANINIPKFDDDKQSKIFWNEKLPHLAIKKAKSQFDAILVDEYQDFYDDWIRLCVKLCKVHNYQNNSNKSMESINLFLAGDRLQSIYNTREQSWKQLGIDMRGRSRLLKNTYRSSKDHINLALDFLMQDQNLKEEVENFYHGRQKIESSSKNKQRISFVNGNYNYVASFLGELIYEHAVRPENFLILCPTRKTVDLIYAKLSDDLKNKTTTSKIKDNQNKMIITTYHSSKGLERPICFLVDTCQIHKLSKQDILNKKLLYVGMTRAFQKLYLHYQDLNQGNFIEQLNRIYN